MSDETGTGPTGPVPVLRFSGKVDAWIVGYVLSEALGRRWPPSP